MPNSQELYQKMAALKDYTTICNSAPSEILSLIALRNREKIIKRHLDRIERNLKLLDIFFTKYKDLFSWIKPRAGTVAFPKFKINVSTFNFCETAVRETGIMILPSSVYDYDDKHFRLGFGRENMREALWKFEKYIESKFI